MRALLLVLLAWSTEAGFRMEGYDGPNPRDGSPACASHTLSWTDAGWTNVQNPHESVDNVACLDFFETDYNSGASVPVSMKIDATACSSSSSELILMTTYDSHGCGNDVDQVFNFTDGQCRRQDTDPFSCFFMHLGIVYEDLCQNLFSVRLSCWDGSHPTSGDDDDAPATASTEVLLVLGILLLLVGVGAGVFISRRRPAPEAPAVIQMATHVVVDNGQMAKADPESPAPPIVAAAEEVPPPVWT